MSLMNSPFLLQQCPACLVRLTWMGGKWPYSCYFAGCCFQDFFTFARSNLVQFPSSFLSIRFVTIHVVHPYSYIDTAATWKKSRFILSNRSDFHIINGLSIAIHAFGRRISTSLSVDEMLLPRYVNLSTNFRGPPISVEGAIPTLNGGHMHTHTHTYIYIYTCYTRLRLPTLLI